MRLLSLSALALVAAGFVGSVAPAAFGQQIQTQSGQQQQTTPARATSINFNAYIGSEVATINVYKDGRSFRARGVNGTFEAYDLEMDNTEVRIVYNGSVVATYNMSTGVILRKNAEGVQERVQAPAIAPPAARVQGKVY